MNSRTVGTSSVGISKTFRGLVLAGGFILGYRLGLGLPFVMARTQRTRSSHQSGANLLCFTFALRRW